MNWKLRFMNKATLTALVGIVVAFVYQICGLFGIVPPISQEQIIEAVGLLLTILAGLGVVVDPTTNGLGDSERAKGYDEPFKEE